MVVRRKATGHTHEEMLSVDGLNEEVDSRIDEKNKTKKRNIVGHPPIIGKFDSQLGEPE